MKWCTDGTECSDVELFLPLLRSLILNGANVSTRSNYLHHLILSKNLVYVYCARRSKREGSSSNRAFTSDHRVVDEESQRGTSAGPRRKKIVDKDCCKLVG